MTPKLAAITIHGMGSHKPTYADNFITKTRRMLENKHGVGRDEVAWRPVHWTDILEGKQDTYYRAIRRKTRPMFGLREFVVTAFGDAVAYQPVRSKSEEGKTYTRVHDEIRGELKTLYKEDLGGKSVPLVIIASSLGGHIMSNFVWDTQAADSKDLSGFEKMHSLAGIVTLGCNIPLFAMACEKIEAIQFPPPSLPDDLRSKAQWLNLYDRDDVLGYPLKPLSKSYEAVVTEDISVNVGNFLKSWNPLSHTGYWKDRDVIKHTANLIAGLIK